MGRPARVLPMSRQRRISPKRWGVLGRREVGQLSVVSMTRPKCVGSQMMADYINMHQLRGVVIDMDLREGTDKGP